MITIYTDGACKGNGVMKEPKGGWGFVAIENSNMVASKFGSDTDTTNNRMELTAVIMALYEFEGKKVHIISDSNYVIKGITEWIVNWRKKNFKKVKNVDLWKELDELVQIYSDQVSWEWVKGHDGNEYNEMADSLACRGAEEALMVKV